MKSMLGVGNLPFAIPLPNDVKSLIPKSSATKTIKLGLSSILFSGPFSQINYKTKKKFFPKNSEQ